MNLIFLVTRLNQIKFEAAKISVLPSKEMNRYRYLTGEDLGYKSEVLRKVKFEHFPLGQVLKKIL